MQIWKRLAGRTATAKPKDAAAPSTGPDSKNGQKKTPLQGGSNPVPQGQLPMSGAQKSETATGTSSTSDASTDGNALMAGKLTFEQLKEMVASNEIDTVLAVQTDMQGRLMGKRFHAESFVESAWEETHSCNYLQATDMEMLTVDGYKSTSWEAGYGDYTMKPDLATLRRIPWLEGTALVMCDVLDHHTHADVPHAPRSILKRQIERLDAMGLKAMMASELEFFLFKESYEQIAEGARPTLISPYNEDYHIFQTTKEEDVMRAVRNDLNGADVPVENSKGEADAGQEEINVRYADVSMPE